MRMTRHTCGSSTRSCNAAGRHGLLLHPALLMGGEVGDAFWDVPWRAGRHPHRDAALVDGQASHAGMLARRWAGDPPRPWPGTSPTSRRSGPFGDTTDDEARAWTSAPRSGDPGRRPRRAGDDRDRRPGDDPWSVGPTSWPASSTSPASTRTRSTTPGFPGRPAEPPHHACGGLRGCAGGGGTGRPVMVHEYGPRRPSSTRSGSPPTTGSWRGRAWGAERPASSPGAGPTPSRPRMGARPTSGRRMRPSSASSTRAGSCGSAGSSWPSSREPSRAWTLDSHAAFGPSSTAAIVVPHEYARPYDPAGYGLEGAPSGHYLPAETAWTPVRDPRPLVAGWLNAYVMGARAGLAASFPRERLDGASPNARLVLLPAPSAGTSGSLHLRTTFWDGAAAHLARGGSAWVSCSADVAIPEMAVHLGARIVDRAPAWPRRSCGSSSAGARSRRATRWSSAGRRLAGAAERHAGRRRGQPGRRGGRRGRPGACRRAARGRVCGRLRPPRRAAPRRPARRARAGGRELGALRRASRPRRKPRNQRRQPIRTSLQRPPGRAGGRAPRADEPRARSHPMRRSRLPGDAAAVRRFGADGVRRPCRSSRAPRRSTLETARRRDHRLGSREGGR